MVVNPLLLRNSPAQSVDDILSMLSGVNTTRSDGISNMHTNVSIRGLAGDEQGRTLVLFDGIPINTSDEGSVNWNSIHIDNVQRIEVFKGPGSSLYGNSAMGGVINIISKRPVSPFSLNTSGSYGSLNTWKTDLGLSSRINDKFAIFLSGYYNKSDGFNNIPDSLRTEPDYSVARFMKEGGLYAKVLYNPTALFNVDLAYDLYRDKRGEGEKIQAPDGEYRHFNHNGSKVVFTGKKENFLTRRTLFSTPGLFQIGRTVKRRRLSAFRCKISPGRLGSDHAPATRRTYKLLHSAENLRMEASTEETHYVTSTDEVLTKAPSVSSLYSPRMNSVFSTKKSGYRLLYVTTMLIFIKDGSRLTEKMSPISTLTTES